MDIAEVVMNPVRQRIFQYFLLHETGTVKEVKNALSDVPSASLYRHMKILADSSILVVVGENRIRGTVESVYKLNKDAMAAEDENGNGVHARRSRSIFPRAAPTRKGICCSLQTAR